MESDDELKGPGNSYDFGARIYDPRVGRWLSTDPAYQEYSFASPYNFVLNTPIQAIDPDGKRVYFVAGAGNDKDGWDYMQRFNDIWEKKGIKNFERLDASHGKWGDVSFTANFRNSTHKSYTQTHNEGNTVIVKLTDIQINNAVEQIVNDLAKNPLEEGEQLNLGGYSYGSVLQAHVALELADRGIKVDNLLLVGSPIGDNSDLFKKLSENSHIGNISRFDIKGDLLSNPSNDLIFNAGGIQNSVDSGAHFDLARPGKEADKKIGEADDKFIKEGVK